ncbi:MAG: toprim domain-containing protein [Candidatus Auribacter fodinae]|jgi:5S rRNA maturation endonuclease (ribonuclease M5)|uniref:Toprim domain-containing protein n=1 Tax=Candidatus Auribacter fodinae TaxID=2093366 RepID=A0A3A4RH92_9BACT|nr:MAG: toprim domain-containing protein [Candidatus Auribacter fodinae]
MTAKDDLKEAIKNRIPHHDVYGTIKNQKPSSGDWISGKCPFHDDNTNSFAFNKVELNWQCFAGCGKGSVFDFIMKQDNKSFSEVINNLADKFNLSKEKNSLPPISENLIDLWKENLISDNSKLSYLLEQRGLSLEIIKKYEIGWDNQRKRYSIPIRDHTGLLVNVRFYSPDKNPKIINYVNKLHRYGSVRLYGVNEIIDSNCNEIIVCEGEWDRLILRQHGFMAVTSTNGCQSFKKEWNRYFQNKHLIFIFDCDAPGQNAATEIIANSIDVDKLKSIKNVVLPLTGDKDDKDISDYFTKHNHKSSDLRALINNTQLFNVQTNDDKPAIKLDSFCDISQGKYIDQKIQVEITIHGETSETFHAVEEFEVMHCTRKESGTCCSCNKPIILPRDSREFIGSCMSTDVQIINMLRSFCCPFNKKPALNITKRTPIKEFFCHQKIDRLSSLSNASADTSQKHKGIQAELSEQKVYYLSAEAIKPGNYCAIGYVK